MTNSASDFKVIDVTATAADGRSAGLRMIASMEGSATPRFVFRKDRYRLAECDDGIHFTVEMIDGQE